MDVVAPSVSINVDANRVANVINVEEGLQIVLLTVGVKDVFLVPRLSVSHSIPAISRDRLGQLDPQARMVPRVHLVSKVDQVR